MTSGDRLAKQIAFLRHNGADGYETRPRRHDRAEAGEQLDNLRIIPVGEHASENVDIAPLWLSLVKTSSGRGRAIGVVAALQADPEK